MKAANVFLLFVVTAAAEIAGCYLPYLWLRKAAPVWILIPAAMSLVLFVWLLSLHPHAAGRTYAAYGGVYVAAALAWLWAAAGSMGYPRGGALPAWNGGHLLRSSRDLVRRAHGGLL